MSTEKFKNIYRIPSARATWHKYSGGTYFVTICTQKREHYFGEIIYDEHHDPKMNYTAIGEYAVECIAKMETIHDDIYVPQWVVMPNHIHLLVVVAPVQTSYHGVSTPSGVSANPKMQKIANDCGRLSHVISRFKAVISKYAHQNHILFSWQTRFHDHIVRNWDELNRISEYIQHNPDRWAADKFNDAMVTQ